MNVAPSLALLRQSVRYAAGLGEGVAVVDLDGSYRKVAGELVLNAAELGMPSRTLHLWAAALGGKGLANELASDALAAVRGRFGGSPQILAAGVLLLPTSAGEGGVRLDTNTLASVRSVNRSETGGLRADGAPVASVDLSGVDPDRPWLFDARGPLPRVLLSRYPDLAEFVAKVAADVRSDQIAAGSVEIPWDMSTTSLGCPLDGPMRRLYESASASAWAGRPPDPYDSTERDSLRSWLTTPSMPGQLARYLEAVYQSRPDLQEAFPDVTGDDARRFLDWVATHAAAEGYPAEIVDGALRSTPKLRPAQAHRASGVTVVGYLTAELGIGESARRMVDALAAAGVPHAARPIDLHLASRHAAAPVVPDGPVYDTTLFCVNADLTPAVAATVPELVRRSYRIGMWYWEVEEFPVSQHGGFAAVDEVWVATDFVHRAIAPHSPVPVRTLTPPLPQRGPEPQLTKADLGLPDRPVFLFSFDYLSTAERKNPVGLVDAFEQAFEPDAGPVLVIKSINADKRVADAERLRLRAASRPDVLLLEDYLDADARDALVARCDCYVSLHRSEGLGLTMAEAMAWGKPVIATAYSGNLQFMTDENSFLVPWSPVAIPADAPPYPRGAVWADPDLDAAVAFMRLVVDSPDVAAARGARAAQDIATLHNAEVAGRRIAARLVELEASRRSRSRRSLVRAARRSARAALDAFRDELR